MPAFMYPQNNVPDQVATTNKKSKLPLIIGLVIILIAAGAALAFAASQDKKAPTPQPAAQTSAPIDQTPSQTQATYPLTQDITVASNPSFNIPQPDGWQKDPAQAALNGLIHSGGCKVTFTQAQQRSTGELAALDDSGATDKVLADTIKGLEDSATVSGVTYGTTVLKVQGKSDTVEFKTVAFQYANDLSEAKSIITARSVDGYVMGVRFFCQTPAFSETLNTAIINELTLTLANAQ
jgi:hypothetical protein